MDDLIKKHLQDILTAIEEIESFFGDKPKLFDDFYSNLCLRRAIERNIEIIGDDILWSMVINHLPKLKNEVVALLDNE